MSRFYEHLMTEYEVGPDKMHIFGYSLGAQIAAYVANEIKDIQRITGKFKKYKIFILIVQWYT